MILASRSEATKQCRGCCEPKPLADFYPHSRMADGRLNFCKPCVKDRVKAHRAENVEQARAYDARRHREKACRGAEARRAKTAARRKSSLDEVPEQFRKVPPTPTHDMRVRAASKVSRALREGRLIRGPCVACGSQPAHAHHPDYSKPLDVVWLCVRHHEAIHHAGPA